MLDVVESIAGLSAMLSMALTPTAYVLSVVAFFPRARAGHRLAVLNLHL